MLILVVNGLSWGAWLGHTRLAIRELSSAGGQSMNSACGNLTLIFNGEIYNHDSIRDRLDSEGFDTHSRGSSDTETLLAALSARGVGVGGAAVGVRGALAAHGPQ